jgi:hypothetical protein
MSKTVIADNSSCGKAFHMLCGPAGIFVTINLDLYIADCGNNRIQLFELGQLIGKTVIGDMKTISIKLKCPSSVILDVDGNLFIVDFENNRIIRSNSNGFYCLVGCQSVEDSKIRCFRWAI